MDVRLLGAWSPSHLSLKWAGGWEEGGHFLKHLVGMLRRQEHCSIPQLGASNFLFQLTRKLAEGGRGPGPDSNVLGKMDIKWRSPPMGEVHPTPRAPHTCF